jgi:hypothetical protein
MDLMQRRRELMMMGGGNPYPDWMMGWALKLGGTVEDATSALSPYIAVDLSSTTTLLWYNYFSENGVAIKTYYIEFYDANKSKIASFNSNNAAQYNYDARRYNPTATMKSAAFVRFCVKMSEIDNAYLLDTTNNVYIWKGNNV